jgi:NADH-quinone oxidoreductase subunit J
LLGAEFIAAVQVIVYAGAIMVLFVFVIMLLNAEAEQPTGRSLVARYIGIPSLVVFLGVMALLLHALIPSSEQVIFGAFAGGTPRNIGRALFTDYLLPFEITSVLILVAILGAIVLAHKEID